MFTKQSIVTKVKLIQLFVSMLKAPLFVVKADRVFNLVLALGVHRALALHIVILYHQVASLGRRLEAAAKVLAELVVDRSALVVLQGHAHLQLTLSNWKLLS